MLLLAIDLYGIEPFQKPTRIPLQPGLNIITGGNGAGKTIIRRVLASLLLGEPLRGIRFAEDRPAQAAVILRGKDNATYRITADYQKEIFNLSKWDPSSKGILIEKDRSKITSWVCDQAGGFTGRMLSSLFIIDRPDLPSVTPRTNGSNEKVQPRSDAASGTAVYPSPFPDERRAENERQLQEVRRKIEEVTQAEEALLNIRDTLSELKRRLSQLHDLDLQWNHLSETETKRFSGYAGMEAVRPETIRQYEEAFQNKQNELTNLEERHQGVQAELGSIGETDLFQDRFLRIGVGTTLVSFLLPVVITLYGPFRYLFPIGILGGTGLSFFAYLQANRKVALKEKLEKESASLTEKIHQIERKFEKGFKETIDLLAKAGCKEIQEFKDRLRNYHSHLQKKKEISEKRETLLKMETVEEVDRKIRDLENQAKEFERKLEEQSGLSEEAYRLEESLRSLASSIDTSPGEVSIDMPDLGPLPTAAIDTHPSGIGTILLSLKNGKTPPLSLESVEQQLNILFSIFKHPETGKIGLSENGDIKINRFDVNQISSGMSDQIFLSFLVATFDQFPDVVFPLILDEPLCRLAPSNQEAALELLRGAAKRKQIVLFTIYDSVAKKTDYTVALNPS